MAESAAARRLLLKVVYTIIHNLHWDIYSIALVLDRNVKLARFLQGQKQALSKRLFLYMCLDRHSAFLR